MRHDDAGRSEQPASPIGPVEHGGDPAVSVDPLAETRSPQDPAFDVFLTGTVFLDIVFTGLHFAPAGGTEVWADGMGSCPGGIANLAIATSRLGLNTALAAAFGDDFYGDFCWESLAVHEDVDLSLSHRVSGWHSPVTVSLAYDGERAMVTHGHPPPPGEPNPAALPCARASVVHLTPGRRHPWVERAKAQGSLVFADVGWDETNAWSTDVLADLPFCHAFLPNATEAMRYTRTATRQRAVRRLADIVPVAVVTDGPNGALAIDNITGESAEAPGLMVEALDPTGAGDVFTAGFITGTLAGWPLTDRLLFSNLAAALSVRHFGGSLAAPDWLEIATWWWQTKRDPAAADLADRYRFLDDLAPPIRPGQRHRAVPTIGFRGQT